MEKTTTRRFSFAIPLLKRTYSQSLSKNVFNHLTNLEVEYIGSYHPEYDNADDLELAYEVKVDRVTDENGNDLTDLLQAIIFEGALWEIENAARANVEWAFDEFFEATEGEPKKASL